MGHLLFAWLEKRADCGSVQGGLVDADDLKRHATAAGLDLPRFESCLDSGRFGDGVDEDLRSGQALGVTGTPAFFINGRLLSGARPFQDFKRLIEEELGGMMGREDSR